MMLRMPNALTLSSHANRMSAVTRSGQPIVAAYLPMLFRMAGLDRLAQMANQAIEGFILGHGNMPRARKIDRQFVDDRRRPTTHDQDAVGEECRFTDAVGDENHRLPVGLPDALKLDRHFVARDRIQRAERLIHQQDAGVVHERAGKSPRAVACLPTADAAAARRIRRFSPCAAIPALAAGIADVAASAVRWERARFAAPCARATEPGSGTPRRLPAAARPLWHLGFEFRPRWDRSVRQSS